jgi:hypothetical protein
MIITNDKVLKIAETVYKSTINGSLKWVVYNSIFSNDTTHYYQSFSGDGKTKFLCCINIKGDLSDININHYDALRIYNKDIVDGVVSCYVSDSNYVELLHRWIYNNHVKDTLVSTKYEVYNEIIKSIDVSAYREDKINKIIDNDMIIDEKGDKVITEKKESKIKKFFKEKYTYLLLILYFISINFILYFYIINGK